MKNNQITRVPPDIVKLTELQVLCLDNNHISEVPVHVYSMAKVKKFTLDHNPLPSGLTATGFSGKSIMQTRRLSVNVSVAPTALAMSPPTPTGSPHTPPSAAPEAVDSNLKVDNLSIIS